MTVKPYVFGRNKQQDELINSAIQQGIQQHGEGFFDIMEKQYGISKESYMNSSYKNYLDAPQAWSSNTSSSPTRRDPISSYTPTQYTQPKNILPWTKLWQYGDTGGASQANKYQGHGVGTIPNSNLRLSDISNNQWGFLWNDRARAYERNNAGYLTKRNDFLANAFYNEGIQDKEGIGNYLNQFWDFANAQQSDKDNTITAIWNRIGEIRNSKNTDFPNSGSYDLNRNRNNTSDSDYWDFVNTTLRTNFDKFGDLEQIKKTYGDEAYYKLREQLVHAKNAYDLSSPEDREKLSADMQNILWQFVGNQSDLSKLKLNMESGLSLFSPEAQQEIKSDLEKLGQLEGMGKTAQEIASELWWDVDKVYQLNLLKQGSSATRLGKYYNLSDAEIGRLSEEANISRQRLKEDFEISNQRQERERQQFTDDFNKNYERQKRQNEINEGNMNMIAGLTGIGFTSRGLHGLQEVQTQGKEILDDMLTKFERGKIQLNDVKMDLLRNYQRNDADIVRKLNESLMQVKNSYLGSIASLQTKYGLVSMEGQKALAETTRWFIESAQKFYLEASQNARENLRSLLESRTQMMTYEAKQLELSNAKKQQFMTESMYMTPQMAMQYAKENGFENQIDQVLNYQMQATVNTLESYAPWTGMKYQGQIQALLNKGYTPAQVINSLMNRSDFAFVNKDASKGQKSRAPIPIQKGTRGVYDPDTGKTIYFGEEGNVAGSNINLEGGLQNFVANNPVGTKWGQCGTFTNNYLNALWISEGHVENSYESKIATINSATPQIGAVAIINKDKLKGDKYGSIYGHTGIVTAVNDDGTVTLLDSNRNNDHQVHHTKWNMNKIAGYYVPQASSEPMSDNGIPISYEQKIYNLVPTSLKNSDTELKNLYSKAKQLYKAGMSPEDAVLTFMGFKVSEKDKPFAQMILDHARIGEVSEDFYGKISDYINKGNKIQAIKLMENQLKSKAENKGNVKESTAISMIKMINELEEKMAEGEKKFWPISGRRSKGYSKWLGGKETQAINSQIVSIYSQLRNQMNGTNVTESETKWLEPLIPDMNDKYENAKVKIATMKNKILADLNGVRQDLNLPLLDSQSLIDNNARLQLYMNGGNSYQTRGIQGNGKKVNSEMGRT